MIVDSDDNAFKIKFSFQLFGQLYDEIEQMSNFEFVGKIFQLLIDEGVFEPPEGMKSWDFIQPEELEKTLDLEIGNDGLPQTRVDEILRDIVKYSIKPNHQFYQHELSGGYDPHSLAATWVATALNNCQ